MLKALKTISVKSRTKPLMLKETVNKLCVTLYIYSVIALSGNIFSLKDNSLKLSLNQAKTCPQFYCVPQ